MLFSGSIFLFLFLPVVLVIYFLILKKRRSRNLFLLVASLGFYAWGEPVFVLVMILSIIGNWFFGLSVDKHRHNKVKSKIIIISMLLVNFSIMFIFKYLMFFLKNLNHIMKTTIPVPNILLPIGISFFTFQAVSYVLDVYRKDAEVQHNLLDVAFYISFFPQLIAGPIVRYKTVSEQINYRNENFEDFSEGVQRFIIGLSKKVLIANNMAIIADRSFAMPTGELSVGFAWLGVLAYSFQIFFDFAGYSDMAIGLGRMFGFHFLENFNFPYISRSVSEFWRRWHISLGTWFRDYVYFPMGGSKVDTKLKLVFNLFVVWSLTGLWHGASWTFVLWGLFYFILLSIEKLTDFDKRINGKNCFTRVYVLLVVIAGWVLFRADSITGALDYLKVMFGFTGSGLLDDFAVGYLRENIYLYIFAIIFSMPVSKWVTNKLKISKVQKILYPVIHIALFILSMSYIIKGSYNPFIYFNF